MARIAGVVRRKTFVCPTEVEGVEVGENNSPRMPHCRRSPSALASNGPLAAMRKSALIHDRVKYATGAAK